MSSKDNQNAFREKYKRINQLGRGAFGVAYLVQHREGKVKLAAKEIHLSHMTAKDQEATMNEALLLKKLSHPNIIGYVDTILDGNRLYIVMEFADGGDLAGRIRDAKEDEKSFAEAGIMLVFTQLSLALQYIHGMRILHRDIKPMNIFLTKQGAVKLGDFGIARVLEGSTGDNAKTQIGTPYYISPEVCKREDYGIKSDLWALGVVTYELAALKPPFVAQCLPAVAMAICESKPKPIPDTYSPNLERLIFGFLEKEPHKRPNLNDVLNIPFVKECTAEIESKFNSTMIKAPSESDKKRRSDVKGPSSKRVEQESHDRTLLPQADAYDNSRGHAWDVPAAGKPSLNLGHDKTDDLHSRTKHRLAPDDRSDLGSRRHSDYSPAGVESHHSEQAEYRPPSKSKVRQDTVTNCSFYLDDDHDRERGMIEARRRKTDRDRAGDAERKKLEDLERARLAALEDRRIAQKRMQAIQADLHGDHSGPAQAEKKFDFSPACREQPANRRDSTRPHHHEPEYEPKPRQRDTIRKEKEERERLHREELERARIETLEERRKAKERWKKQYEDAGQPQLADTESTLVEGSGKSEGRLIMGSAKSEPSRSRRGSNAQEEDRYVEASPAHSEFRARRKEQERAQEEALYKAALEKARVEAFEERRLAKERHQRRTVDIQDGNDGENRVQGEDGARSQKEPELEPDSTIEDRRAREIEEEKTRLEARLAEVSREIVIRRKNSIKQNRQDIIDETFRSLPSMEDGCPKDETFKSLPSMENGDMTQMPCADEEEKGTSRSSKCNLMEEQNEMELTQWPTEEEFFKQSLTYNDGPQPILKDSLSLSMTGESDFYDSHGQTELDEQRRGQSFKDAGRSTERAQQKDPEKELQKYRLAVQEDKKRIRDRLRGEDDEPLGTCFESTAFKPDAQKALTDACINDADMDCTETNGVLVFNMTDPKPRRKTATKVSAKAKTASDKPKANGLDVLETSQECRRLKKQVPIRQADADKSCPSTAYPSPDRDDDDASSTKASVAQGVGKEDLGHSQYTGREEGTLLEDTLLPTRPTEDSDGESEEALEETLLPPPARASSGLSASSGADGSRQGSKSKCPRLPVSVDHGAARYGSAASSGAPPRSSTAEVTPRTSPRTNAESLASSITSSPNRKCSLDAADEEDLTIAEGHSVRVLLKVTGIIPGSSNKTELAIGTSGEVQEIDEDGDAYIKFEGVGGRFIKANDLSKLEVLKATKTVDDRKVQPADAEARARSAEAELEKVQRIESQRAEFLKQQRQKTREYQAKRSSYSLGHLERSDADSPGEAALRRVPPDFIGAAKGAKPPSTSRGAAASGEQEELCEEKDDQLDDIESW